MCSKVATFALLVAVAHSSAIGGAGYSSFSYGVSDPHTGDIKSQKETRVGDKVVGQYSLIDSDGTRRTVDYSADAHNGFNAVVRKDPAIIAGPAHITAPVLKASPALYTSPVLKARPALYPAPVLNARPALYPAPVLKASSAYLSAPVLKAAPAIYSAPTLTKISPGIAYAAGPAPAYISTGSLGYGSHY